MINLKSLVLGLAVSLAPLAAGAVTLTGIFATSPTAVVVNDSVGGSVISEQGDGPTLSSAELVNGGATSVSIGGTGTINGLSRFISPISVGYSLDGLTFASLFAVIAGMVPDTASYLITPFTLAPGESVFLLAEYAGATRSFGTIDFAVDVAPIPLPAGAWMLLGGLAGLGMLARRRSVV